MKTKTGFEFNIDPRWLRDVRFLKLYKKIQEDDLAVLDLIELLMGDQEQALYDHVAEEGFVDLEKVADELADIFEQLAEDAETKKS